MAVAEHEQQLVELRALELEFLARNLVAHVTAFPIISHLEGLEGDFARVHFVVAAGFREPGILRAVFGQKRFQVSDDVLGQVLEVLAGLSKVGFDLLHLFAVLVDVEKGNPADTDLEEAVDIRVSDRADEFLGKGLEAVVNRGSDRFVSLALLDALVDALLDEDAFEGSEMEFLLQLGLPQFELALEDRDELGRVFAQHLGHGHLDRPVITDQDDPAGQGDFAIREGVQRIDELLGADSRRGAHLDLDVLGREIVDALDLDFPLREASSIDPINESVVVVGGISLISTVESSFTLIFARTFTWRRRPCIRGRP